LFKEKEGKMLLAVNKSKKNIFLFSIENQAVESFGLFIVVVIIFLSSVFTVIKVISFSASDIRTFPNNLYIHFYLLVNPVFLGSICIITYFLKHVKMRQFISMELKRIANYH
jgi:hypothetical protein